MESVTARAANILAAHSMISDEEVFVPEEEAIAILRRAAPSIRLFGEDLEQARVMAAILHATQRELQAKRRLQ
jgi:hypothetical protein